MPRPRSAPAGFPGNDDGDEDEGDDSDSIWWCLGIPEQDLSRAIWENTARHCIGRINSIVGVRGRSGDDASMAMS